MNYLIQIIPICLLNAISFYSVSRILISVPKTHFLRSKMLKNKANDKLGGFIYSFLLIFHI